MQVFMKQSALSRQDISQSYELKTYYFDAFLLQENPY